ncbi:hypothetical protein ES288_A05G444000v1 [Gossypium darwinii]|uniref:Transcription elongation factor spt6 n=1 Tax=Gossypium darwinii TaxID=34276 RepID=A0A5D2GRP9_GOSDA|nr:hypothetical protein ES288_A05G444000v1 [Gossypium darwinii]
MKRKGLTSTYEDNPGEEGEENMEALDDDDEEENRENLDQFECDGFIVDDEEEEEDENDQVLKSKKTKKKKRKMRSVKDPVLYDDDSELVQENRISGICQFPKRLKKAGKFTKVVEQSGSSSDEGLLFDDIFGEEEASFCGQTYEMSDFIVDDKVPITDDANQTLNHQKQVQASKMNLDNSSEFEPFLLANKYTTEREDLIRQTDIPERMQMIEEIVGPLPLDKRSIEEETIWIHNQLVPFIAMYRKEQCLSLLDDFEQNEVENEDNDAVGQAGQVKWHKVLWIIKEFDKMWLLLQKHKSVLQMHQRKIYDEECLKIDNSEKYTLNKQLFESISKSLNEAETKEEIDDVDAKFCLHFLSAEEKMDGKFKRPIRKSLYSNCMMAGLWKLASQFRYASEQLSLQIALEKMDMEFRDYPDEPPEEIALNFTCAMFETPELVLKGARHMAALELSCEPCIKKHIRSIFREKVVVSTNPTPEGNVTIDCFHQLSSIKWLRDKPLSEFNDAQWLLIQKAEEEKLLQVSIKMPETTLNKLIIGFSDVYLIEGAGRSAQLWKEQYKLILHDAIFNFMLPAMEKEARNFLTARAKHWLLMECGKELWKMVSVGPYSCNVILGSVESVAPKVMACCWGPGKPATTFVMLDSSGVLLDTLEARSFSLRSQTVDDKQRKKNDRQRVLKIMKSHQPHVIVIGAANASCVRLRDDVKEIISKLEENLRDLGQATGGISVVFGDESLPQLYEHSEISSDQLPEQPGIVKRAVALGRYLQNPLAMLSSLDNFLTPDEKYEMIEQVMVDVTNQVGVDINFAVRHDWYFPLLQFVSGLGPRKASILQRETVQYRAVNSRKELASFGLKTEKVFHNAAGFLCVRSSRLPCTSFDGTRIHPESYELAERLAEAVCNNITETPLEYVKNEPQVLSTFDINDFSDNYEKETGENRRETFYLIKMELLHGFLDPRKPYKAPSPDEEFNMICGKNGTAVAEGRFVQAIVRHVRPQQTFCVLDSGLTGIIMKDDFLDEDDDCSLQNKLHEGDHVSCKIKQIDKSKCQALLTCKESEMKRIKYENFGEVDPYYHEGGIIPLNQQHKSCIEEKLGKEHFMPRTISHPCFTNVAMDEAMEFLSDKDAGESIFRPSSRGPSYLTLTLKVFTELYVNKDIAESGKDHKDIKSMLHLGKTLKIGDKTFGDLDEVMDRYVAPLVKHLKEMLGFRKFKRGSKAEVDGILTAEKAEYPLRIVYYFGVSYEHPGTFILSYIRSKNLHHEYIGLLPNGFRFRKQTFEKIEHLVGYFQTNINALQHKGRGGRRGRGPGDGGRHSSSWGGKRDVRSSGDSFDSNGAWHAGGNNAGDRGRGRGRGCSRSQSWGGKEESGSGGNDGAWNSSRNDAGGRGRGRGRGCSRSHSWGGKEESGSGSNDGAWNSSGNYAGGYGHNGGRSYGGRNGNWDGVRRGRSGSARRGRGNERESEFCPKSFNWCSSNEIRKWNHDAKMNFPGDTKGSWGHDNVTNDGDGSCGNVWNSNASRGGNSCWGRHVPGNQGGWSSGGGNGW